MNKKRRSQNPTNKQIPTQGKGTQGVRFKCRNMNKIWTKCESKPKHGNQRDILKSFTVRNDLRGQSPDELGTVTACLQKNEPATLRQWLG